MVIEHNLEVIKTADWVIDLGPEGGARGGELLAIGTPEQVAAAPQSFTGGYLARVLPEPPTSADAPLGEALPPRGRRRGARAAGPGAAADAGADAAPRLRRVAR